MRFHSNSIDVTLVVCALTCLLSTQASSHGVMRAPASRAIGTPGEDYQFCFGTPGCECGEFPDPGSVTASYHAGQTIEVTIDITQSHDSAPIFRFQLCPPDQQSQDCFASGEFASAVFDQTLGIHAYEIKLPDGLECDPCVLRWKWDYGFLSCADVSITTAEVGLESRTAWAALKARYR